MSDPTEESPEADLRRADDLLNQGDPALALEHTRRAQAAMAAANSESPQLVARLACRLIDCGADLRSLDPVREGLEILESNYNRLRTVVLEYSLQYNLGNAKKTVYDLEAERGAQPFSPVGIAVLTEAKDHYWRAVKSLEKGQSDPQLCVNLANALDQCGRVAEALSWYDAALSLSPGFPMAHLNRGLALLTLNLMSGTLSISQLDEARRSFGVAEASDLPPHLVALAREHGLAIAARLLELGWTDARIREYDEQHLQELTVHDQYWQFCLGNYLALNEHALYCRCAGARRDDLAIPPTSDPVGGEFVPRLELLLNRVKSEFCLARALYYQAGGGLPAWHLIPFEGTFSELGDQEAIGLSAEFLRTSFRLCFGILDRIAQGVNELFKLSPPTEALYFESFWRPAGERKKGREVRWEKINAQQNLGLVALYSIATDLNREGGEWGFFKGYRNCLEHGLLVVLEGREDLPELATPSGMRVEQVPLDRFREQSLLLLKITASAILSFAFCVRDEGRRSLPVGPAVQQEIGKKTIGKA